MILYNLFIQLYQLGVRIAALWMPKAAQWLGGRKNLFEDLQKQISSSDRIIWMHCASAGELEQGKTVLEALKNAYPDHKILISFFSPSGYMAGKKYRGADAVCYLPLDTHNNAQTFIEAVQPQLVIFVKYDYWFHHLNGVAAKKIPLLLISAIYRHEQVFFKWYGGFHRKILSLFTWIFVQDLESVQRLKAIGINYCSVSGDTRFDRVVSIVKQSQPIDLIESFIHHSPTIVAGSTWADDEQLFKDLWGTVPCKLIIAPHEIDLKNIRRLLNWFAGEALTYSELQSGISQPEKYSVLIIDNIGMLSRLYQYATIAYIGGGFNKSGIHNTLEAAAWGKPVLFGPNYQKFREAKGLLKEGAAYSVAGATELKTIITLLLTDASLLQKAGASAKNYVQKNRGATATILEYIQEKRLLTTA